MSHFIQAEDGYYVLTNAGCYILVAVYVILLLFAAFIVNKKQNVVRFSAKRLTVCGAAVALGFLLSYVKVFHLPYGGSVTAFSMFCICIVGYFYGIKAGLLSAAAYSILQFLQSGGSYMLSPMQICCDYFLAFTALGITGFFYANGSLHKNNNRFVLGYVLAILTRGLLHVIGGYLYWMDYMPDNFPKSLAALYPIIYNYSYILLEGLITVVVLQIPAVRKAFQKLQLMAQND